MSDNTPDEPTPEFRTALERRNGDDQEDSETDSGGQNTTRGP